MVSTRTIYDNYLRAKYRIPNELSVDGVANKILELIQEKREEPRLDREEKGWVSRFALVLLLSMSCLYIFNQCPRNPGGVIIKRAPFLVSNIRLPR
jgi:hypothetical protein